MSARNIESNTKRLLAMRPDQFATDSAARLLWRICASDRVPGLINGEARLCEAFHSEALAILERDAAPPAFVHGEQYGENDPES